MSAHLVQQISISHKPGVVNLELYRGDSFKRTVIFEAGGSPLNISGDVFRMLLKRPGGQQVFLLTMGNGIQFAGTDRISIELTAAQMQALSKEVVRLEHDLQWTRSIGEVRTVFRGFANIINDVTQP
jgi:hypothetical protein